MPNLHQKTLKTIKPNESNEEGTLHYGDLASRSTFVTMASANGKGRIIQGGELQDGIKSKFGFDSAGGKDGVYKNLQMGSSGEGYRPISGISNISVIYKGGYKAIREATVSWVANSFTDLDDLTPAFLTVGKSVLLEWGWVFSNPKINFSFRLSFKSYAFIKIVNRQQMGDHFIKIEFRKYVNIGIRNNIKIKIINKKTNPVRKRERIYSY